MHLTSECPEPSLVGRKICTAIRHVAFEDLGSFETAFIEAGYEVRYVDVGLDDLDVIAPTASDLLVVLGGPIGVYEQDRYPFLKGRAPIDRCAPAGETADHRYLSRCPVDSKRSRFESLSMHRKGNRIFPHIADTRRPRFMPFCIRTHSSLALAWRYVRSAGRRGALGIDEGVLESSVRARSGDYRFSVSSRGWSAGL